MESKLIYLFSNAYLPKVQWTKQGDSEFLYFGAAEELRLAFVVNIIQTCLSKDNLYVVHGRKGSFETTKQNVIDQVLQLLGKADFYIWDTDFSAIINFNRIGVLRYGQRQSLL